MYVQNGCHQEVCKQSMLERGERKGELLPSWWECKLVQPLWRTVWRFLKKLEIPLLGRHTEETRIERYTCTQCSWQHSLQ